MDYYDHIMKKKKKIIKLHRTQQVWDIKQNAYNVGMTHYLRVDEY